MATKQSSEELIRLVREAVAHVLGLPRKGLWLGIDAVEAQGWPPSVLKVWGTLHFLPDGSPFCCGEPECHLGLRGSKALEIGDHVRRAMGLGQLVKVEFGDRVCVNYHEGVAFAHGGQPDQAQSA